MRRQPYTMRRANFFLPMQPLQAPKTAFKLTSDELVENKSIITATVVDVASSRCTASPAKANDNNETRASESSLLFQSEDDEVSRFVMPFADEGVVEERTSHTGERSMPAISDDDASGFPAAMQSPVNAMAVEVEPEPEHAKGTLFPEHRFTTLFAAIPDTVSTDLGFEPPLSEVDAAKAAVCEMKRECGECIGDFYAIMGPMTTMLQRRAGCFRGIDMVGALFEELQEGARVTAETRTRIGATAASVFSCLQRLESRRGEVEAKYTAALLLHNQSLTCYELATAGVTSLREMALEMGAATTGMPVGDKAAGADSE